MVDLISKELEENDEKLFKQNMEKTVKIMKNPKDYFNYNAEEIDASIITLETIEEAVDSLPDDDERDINKWLPSIMKLL